MSDRNNRNYSYSDLNSNFTFNGNNTNYFFVTPGQYDLNVSGRPRRSQHPSHAFQAAGTSTNLILPRSTVPNMSPSPTRVNGLIRPRGTARLNAIDEESNSTALSPNGSSSSSLRSNYFDSNSSTPSSNGSSSQFLRFDSTTSTPSSNGSYSPFLRFDSTSTQSSNGSSPLSPFFNGEFTPSRLPRPVGFSTPLQGPSSAELSVGSPHPNQPTESRRRVRFASPPPNPENSYANEIRPPTPRP